MPDSPPVDPQALIEGPLAPEGPAPVTEQPPGRLPVATCQFSVSHHIHRNLSAMLSQINTAAGSGARLVHFPEAALSGYLARDRDSWEGFDWEQLLTASQQLCAAAARHRVWLVFGSAHRLSGDRPPHNSAFIIDDEGRLVSRYDKRFCTTNDLHFYTPGDHRVTFEVDGVRCGVAICFDIRFPELYRDYRAAGVDLILQSNYDARGKERTHFRHIMRQTMQTRAATNFTWMSATNSSAHYQSYPSVFIQPDGRIISRLRDHRPGVMVNLVDLQADLHDAAGPHRARALNGAPGNGVPFFDRRSLDRQRW
ncbi:MAG: putative amidohydrolase [Myxococcota bacterium]|jgi:predicted amidohydrolase